jgi:riboflavin synthase
MFTGLVEAVGRIERRDAAAPATGVRVATALGGDLRPGESIAVNGVCLTVTHADAAGFDANVSPETLRVTTLGEATDGRLVNLERPLRADGRVGGHFVLGHVDGVGQIARFARDGDCYWLDVTVPADLVPAVVSRGSIAIDGVSLTVAALAGARVGVQIVPFTFAETSLREARVGDRVNLETDVLGKYVARWLGDRADAGVPAAPGDRRS